MREIKKIKKEIKKIVKDKSRKYFFNLRDPYDDYDVLIASSNTKQEKEEASQRLQDTIKLKVHLQHLNQVRKNAEKRINLKFNYELFTKTVNFLRDINSKFNQIGREYVLESIPFTYYNIPPFKIDSNTVFILGYLSPKTPISIRELEKESLEVLINFIIRNPNITQQANIQKIICRNIQAVAEIIRTKIEYYIKEYSEDKDLLKIEITRIISSIFTDTLISHLTQKKNKNNQYIKLSLNTTSKLLPASVLTDLFRKLYKILDKKELLEIFTHTVKTTKINDLDDKEWGIILKRLIEFRQDISLLENVKTFSSITSLRKIYSILSNIVPNSQTLNSIKETIYYIQTVLSLQKSSTNFNFYTILDRQNARIIEVLLTFKDYIRQNKKETNEETIINRFLLRIMKNIAKSDFESSQKIEKVRIAITSCKKILSKDEDIFHLNHKVNDLISEELEEIIINEAIAFMTNKEQTKEKTQIMPSKDFSGTDVIDTYQPVTKKVSKPIQLVFAF